MQKVYYQILFIYCFSIKNFLSFKQQSQDYIIQIQKQWIDLVKAESHHFGFKFKRKVMSDILLFEGNVSPTEGALVDIKGFKKYFGNKIEQIERREKVIVKYYTRRNKRSKKPELERWIPWSINYAYKKQCWPYYGMDIQEAWSLGYTGDGINVAVIDIGVDVSHPDLTRNIDMNLSYSFVDKNHSNVNPKRFINYIETEEITSHGTMAAGLIGAEFGNNRCSAGVAYNATIAALKVFNINEDNIVQAIMVGFTFSLDHVSSALEHKREEIDIYSCSFNAYHQYKPLTLDMKKALKEGVSKGRKGKGSIYVFSAGNKKGPIHDCNTEALASSIYTITISSIGMNGSRPSYAIPCAATLASTYGEFNTLSGPKRLVTTAQHGMCDFFRGTSASAALAAGIIALTLQANPNLTWRDVQHIIVLSSSHNRLENNGLMQNAAGLQYNSIFGFGLMNATAMALLAEDWLTVPPQKQNTVYATPRDNWLFRKDAMAVTFRASPCDEKDDHCVKFLEHVQIELIYKSQDEDLLDIELYSPSNTCSVLLNRKKSNRIYDNKSNMNHVKRKWIYTSMHFWGENPIGNWVLHFHTGNVFDPGRFDLRIAALTLFGLSTNPSKKFYNVNCNERNIFKEHESFNLTKWYNSFKHKELNENSNNTTTNHTHINRDLSLEAIRTTTVIICIASAILIAAFFLKFGWNLNELKMAIP